MIYFPGNHYTSSLPGVQSREWNCGRVRVSLYLNWRVRRFRCRKASIPLGETRHEGKSVCRGCFCAVGSLPRCAMNQRPQEEDYYSVNRQTVLLQPGDLLRSSALGRDTDKEPAPVLWNGRHPDMVAVSCSGTQRDAWVSHALRARSTDILCRGPDASRITEAGELPSQKNSHKGGEVSSFVRLTAFLGLVKTLWHQGMSDKKIPQLCCR